MPDTNPLTDDERAELESLRAQKAARERAQADRRERAELESLRAEQARERADVEARRAEAARIERAREVMEPDEDLRMPLAQRIVLAVVAVLIAAFVLYIVTNGFVRG